MKRVIILIFFLSSFYSTQAQLLDLSSIVKDAYSKTSDKPVIKGQELSYIVPRFIEFVDTTKLKAAYRDFSIIYFPNELLFEKHLKDVRSTSILNVYFNQVFADRMVITIEILKANTEQYFGSFKLLTFVDKRKVKLKSNASRSRWVYDGLVKLYDEPVAGGKD